MAHFITPDLIQSGDLFIPADPANADYRALLASGLEIEPWEEPTAAELLAAERARMVLTRAQFARQAALAGKMTTAEALAWAGAGTATTLGTAALELVPEGTSRDQASIAFAGAQIIERNNSFIPAVQTVAEWTDEQVDEFFRAGMLL